MLKYCLTDIDGRVTELKKPMKVSFISSENAPADRLTAVFAVRGRIPVIRSADVYDGREKIFGGLVDVQTDECTERGTLLTVSARSLECLLLDNEAMPQTYCMPSMPLLMKRHFEPLGFDRFIGTGKAFNGEMTISKGMSEWSVLKSFCESFTGTYPKITKDGVIDISGETKQEVCVSPDRIISVKHSLKNRALISKAIARTHTGGVYSMPLVSRLAEKIGVKRIRYVNSIDGKSRTVLSAKKLMERSDMQYEQIIVDCCGCIICDAGASLTIAKNRKKYIVSEINYILDKNGEHTVIYAYAPPESERG